MDRVIEHLRAPVEMDPRLDDTVMARIASSPSGAQRSLARIWAWLRRPREIAVSPLSGLVIAAAAALLLWAAPHGDRSARQEASATTAVQFVVVAPGARTVSLVGDFNNWDARLTPMRGAPDGRLWTVTIPLSVGRHRYAFLVNGSRWQADPSAPRAQDDFGAPSSVVTVGG